MSDTELPDEIVRLLNDPADAGEQAIQPLFTVDGQGCPHVTLSSARQWWTGGEHLVCVLAAGRTTRHLAQRPRALLLVVGARQAYSIRLRSIKIEEAGDRLVAVVFDVTAVDSDTRDVALTPMLFQATGELARQERISGHAAATAAQLAQGAPGESWQQRYQIRFRGQLGHTIRSAFPALRARADGGDTVLAGVLADQAALYGVLAEAEALGLELIEVHRLPPSGPRAPSP